MADGAEQHSEALLQQMEREEAAMKIQAVHRGNAARSKLEARLSRKETCLRATAARAEQRTTGAMEQHLASLVPKRRSGIAAPPGVGITLAQHSHRKHVPGSLSRRKKRPDSDRPSTPTFRHHKPGSRPGFLSGRRPVPKTAFVPGSPEHVPGAEQYAFRHEARKQDGQYVFRQKDDDPLLPLQHLLGEPAVHAALRVEALHWNVKGLRDEHARGLGHVLYHNKRLTEVGLARAHRAGP